MPDELVVPNDYRKELDALGLDLEVGDQVIDTHYSSVSTVKEIKYVTYRGSGKTELRIFLPGGDHAISEFLPREDGQRLFYKLTAPLAELQTVAFDSVWNAAPKEAEAPVTSDSTELTVGASSAADVKRMRAGVQAQLDRIGLIQSIMNGMMRAKMDALMRGVSEMREQVEYMTKVVEMMEAYLGVYQEITLLKDGLPAPMDTPLSIRQLLLYMDEEVGDISFRDGIQGIDFKRVEDFDKWLLEDRHYEILIPEVKGIVALKPSRTHRQYSIDWFENSDLNKRNDMSYLLIRNGDKVYRIWAAMRFQGKLFPTAEEYSAILNKKESRYHWDVKDAKFKELDWRQQIVLMQGLIERTDAFLPLASNVNLFDPATFELGRVVMIRDAEGSLTDGRQRFTDWQKQTNSELGRGSRIYLNNLPESHKYYIDRYGGNYSNEYNLPSEPKPGMYTIEEVDKKGRLKILFEDTGSDVYSRYEGYHPRERRVGFWLEPSDTFIVSYEALQPDDVNYWISNRLDRQNYLSMLPLLLRTRAQFEQEANQEELLAMLIVNELGVPLTKVIDAIQWWKTKVINHRPIASDDAKAWRMIRRRVQE